MQHILIIDDDTYINNMLFEALTQEGYHVSRAWSGTEAQLLLGNQRPDLILLDLMLPGLSGEELLPQIKEIPTIVVSAKTDLDEKVQLLLDGAVDYITKPFALRELLARITVQMRRPEHKETQAVLTVDSLSLDTSSHIVTIENKTQKLTKTEFAILKLLMCNPGQAISKSLILEKISMDTPDCTENSLKQHVSNLRKKLREMDEKDHIESVWGIGFRLLEKS